MKAKFEIWKDKLKEIFSLRNVSLMVLIPLVSIFIYKMVSEPIMSKEIVQKSLIETMSTQPELILGTLMDNLPNNVTMTEEEKAILKKEIEKVLRDNYAPITEELGLNIDELIAEVETLKTTSATKQELSSLKEELNKIKVDMEKNIESNKELDKTTKEEMAGIIDSIGKLEEEIEKSNQVDQNLADKISKVLDKITELKKNMNSELDKLRKQLETLEKNQNDKSESQVIDVQSKIDALHVLYNSLDARLVEFITVVNIEELGNTITEFALSIATLNGEMTKIQSAVDQIDLSMITLEDMLNSNIENVDEALKGEIQDVLAKMKKLSDDVYDKSIVDSHIQAIQKALDSIMANAGELDEEMKNKFLQAQKDLESLKQETESGYYDKVAVNNKITEINSNLSDALAQVSNKADKDLQDAIGKVESDMVDFGKNVEAAYKQAIETEVLNLKNELQASINAAAEANKQNSTDITNISKTISQLISRLDTMDGDFSDLTAQLEAVNNLVVSGYYTKEQLDTLLASVQTAMDSIKVDVGNNSTAITGIETDISNLDTQVKEVFQSVSDGKGLLASAITGKGVNADATESFENLSNKIKLITSSTLTGNIKYTYHVHVAGCSTTCTYGTWKVNSPGWTNGGGIWHWTLKCTQCGCIEEVSTGSTQEDTNCRHSHNICGKTTNTIEKAEITFGTTKSRSTLTKLDLEEIQRHNEREQIKAEQENKENSKNEEIEVATEEEPATAESETQEESTENSTVEENTEDVQTESETS